MPKELLMGEENSQRISDAIQRMEDELYRKYWPDEDERDLDAVPQPDGRNIYIGHTINVLEASGATPENIKASVFKKEVYSGEYLETSATLLAEVESQVSSDFAEVFSCKEISASLQTSSQLAFFSGGVENKYGTSGKLSKTALFHNSMAIVQTEKQFLDTSFQRPKQMRSLVKPAVLEIINDETESPETIFRVYGTHIITEASVGGFIQVTGVYRSTEEVSKTEFSMAVNCACSFASATGKAGITDEQKKILSNTTMAARSYGGDVAVTIATLSVDAIKSSFKAWGESIRNTKKQVLSKVHAYMPLWELAEDKGRQNALRDYFITLAQGNFKALSEHFIYQEAPSPPVPVVLVIAYPDPKLPECYLGARNEGTLSGVAGIFLPKVTADNSLLMCSQEDGSVCFKHINLKKYMSVHYNSVVPGMHGRDMSQIFFNGEMMGEKQKFKLIQCSDGKVKIRSLENNKFIRGRIIQIPNYPLLMFFAEEDERNATLFTVKKLA